MKKCISIIIPVYNRPSLVAEAIDSVMLQTSPNWELIVVDDGSTDITWEVLQSYAGNDERIRIFKRDREPKGANRCRNMGAEKATADYLFFLDSDDLIGETFVETREKYIELYPEMDFIVFPEATFETRPENGWWYEKKWFGEEEDLIRFFKWDHPWLISGPVWKKDAFSRIGGFLENLKAGQDWELHVRSLLLGLKHKKIALEKCDVFIRKVDSLPTISNTNSTDNFFINKLNTLEYLLSINKNVGFLEDEKIRKAFLSYFVNLSKKMTTEKGFNDGFVFLKIISKNNVISSFEAFYLRTYLFCFAKQWKLPQKMIESYLYRFAGNKDYIN